MKTYTVAVLGATGAVGQEMIKILQERDFPVGNDQDPAGAGFPCGKADPPCQRPQRR